MTTVGILGAGKLGTVIARLAVEAGYRTLIAASGDPDDIALVVDIMAPGAQAKRAIDAVLDSDLIVLAVPLSKFASLPLAALAGKTVVDAMNYWPSVDGTLTEFDSVKASSLTVAAALPESRVVRGLSHLGYHQLGDNARIAGDPGRHAVAIAGNDPAAIVSVAAFVDRLGFDPVVAGDLSASVLFGPGTSLFGTSAPAAEVRRLLDVDGRPTSAAPPRACHAAVPGERGAPVPSQSA